MTFRSRIRLPERGAKQGANGGRHRATQSDAPRRSVQVDSPSGDGQRQSATVRSSAPGAWSLTAAELRILPLLATHLSGPEIAAELFLSPHTVKSHQLSLYRKLGVTSRSAAVARSRDLALLEG
jgi:DNA-binding CsgD family transcriptional regulator